MNRLELISAVAERTGLSKKDVKVTLQALFDADGVIAQTLTAGGDISIQGFGAFKSKQVAERQGHNPSTGQKMTHPARVGVSFKTGKALKDAVNGVVTKSEDEE